jgi:glycosyltransferase involved in cell wall biosynthesis
LLDSEGQSDNVAMVFESGLRATMTSAQLTVLFATRNGERALARTLEAYRRVAPPSVPWKLVVVDNGSSDATADILRSFKAHLPLELLKQPVTGKNRALNTGIGAVEGALVIISDDDVIPSPSFLVAWEQFLGRREEFELFGGRIEPVFDGSPPRWLLKNRAQFAFMFGERDLPEGPVASDEIYGGNMAVRTAVFARGFRFLETIGPNGDDPLYPMGSEVEFCRRIARSGVMSWFAREPHVQHIVYPHQWAESAWAKRAYRCGRGRAYLMWEEGRTMNPPRFTLMDRIAMLSPLRHHRIGTTCAYHLARGFDDECKRRTNLRLGNPR